MTFQVGDKVVHWVYGLGEIVDLDEKQLSGQTNQYYVVQVNDLTLWVPSDEQGSRCMRPPTPPGEFKKLFLILSSPGEPLSKDRLERKTQLAQRMKSGSLESICLVIRDLSFHRRVQKLSDSDAAILERAQSFLLNEWNLSLRVPISQAREELGQLLGSGTAHSP